MPAQLTIEATPVLPKIVNTSKKLVVQEGGSSSGKTWGFAQALIAHSFNEHGAIYSVVRDTFPALRRSVHRDWKKALAAASAGEYFKEHKTEWSFTNTQTGTVIEFFSVDDEEKAKGPRRQRLWLNEANEIAYAVANQLMMRTMGQTYIDYNPSMLSHWIYDKILPRDDVEYIHTTYKNNRAFLPREIIDEIEIMVPVYLEEDGAQVVDWDLTYKGHGQLIKGDPYRWAVYGLGKRGAPTEAIYPFAFDSKGMPAETVLGLDFGYNHPMVLCRVGIEDVELGRPRLHIDELIHQSYLTTKDVIEMLPGLGVTKQDVIYADGSRPESIQEIQDAGYWCQPAEKGAGSVKAGIDFCKRYDLYYSKRSTKGRAQAQDYRWKKRPDGTIDDEPVKISDDCPDAFRYAAFTHWGRPNPDPFVVVAS